jgi:hypothetical protein
MESVRETDTESVRPSEPSRVFEEEEGERLCALVGAGGINTGGDDFYDWNLYNNALDGNKYEWRLLSVYDCAHIGAGGHTGRLRKGCGCYNGGTQGLCGSGGY